MMAASSDGAAKGRPLPWPRRQEEQHLHHRHEHIHQSSRRRDNLMVALPAVEHSSTSG